jgi:ABC-type uncharacterized transport system fused permease/ATPase subunit
LLLQEIQLFSTGLAQLLYKTVVCPLMIAYYTVLVWTYVGWKGPVAVYLFFSVGTLGARCLISPIAALVAKQEKLEGDFRVAHVRYASGASAFLNSSLTAWPWSQVGCENWAVRR